MIRIVNCTSVKRVLYGINHYVSTGDHLGEGVVFCSGDNMNFIVPVNHCCPIDFGDWQKLLARLHEITYPKYRLEVSRDGGDRFTFHKITIAEKDCRAFADTLCERPGPMGWGSLKKFIDLYGSKPYGFES